MRRENILSQSQYERSIRALLCLLLSMRPTHADIRDCLSIYFVDLINIKHLHLVTDLICTVCHEKKHDLQTDNCGSSEQRSQRSFCSDRER